jgi:glucose-6-phosphate 1-dehydrogenase
MDSGFPIDDPATLATAKPAPPCTFVIFGGGGDLTRRLLMPALYNLRLAGLLPDGFSMLAIDGRDMDDAAFAAGIEESMRHFVVDRRAGHEVALDEAAWAWMRERLHYRRGDFEDPATYTALAGALGGCAVFYLAVPDRFFAPIVDRLAEAGLTGDGPGRFRRVVVEKPFGHDLPTARALNARLLGHLREEQIFRIDHYLGKETVQNIMALRFSNGIFEPIWKRDHIDHVQITVAETVGVERRGRFYESTGALRDMVPNHIFQLLAMVAMEAPTSFDADAVRDEKAKVVHAVRPLSGREVVRDVVRGQYRAGAIGGTELAGYRQEPDVAANSSIETFIAMKLGIDNWRWAGVPFYLRTGKRLAVRRTEVAIHFKQAPTALFRDTPVEKLTPNILTLHIQPSEGVSLQFSAKRPGPTVRLGGVRMAFDYAETFHEGPSTGYETLLYDCLVGDATLFQRADNVEAGWSVVQPILDSWDSGHIHVNPYAAGSAGPEEADDLLARDHRRWAPLA